MVSFCFLYFKTTFNILINDLLLKNKKSRSSGHLNGNFIWRNIFKACKKIAIRYNIRQLNKFKNISDNWKYFSWGFRYKNNLHRKTLKCLVENCSRVPLWYYKYKYMHMVNYTLLLLSVISVMDIWWLHRVTKSMLFIWRIAKEVYISNNRLIENVSMVWIGQRTLQSVHKILFTSCMNMAWFIIILFHFCYCMTFYIWHEN